MNFTIYSKNGCPYCTKVEQVLTHIGAQYSTYKLGDHFTKDQFYDKFGYGTTFPQVTVNDEHLGGCIDTVQYLKEKNLV